MNVKRPPLAMATVRVLTRYIKSFAAPCASAAIIL